MKELKDQIQKDIQIVLRKIELDSNYYEDLSNDLDRDSDELAVLENQINFEEKFLEC